MPVRRSRPVRRAAQLATMGLVGLLLFWALALRPAPLRQFVAEASGYALRGSVYDPRIGSTIGGYEGSGPDLRLSGELRHDLAIAQKQGRRISLISRTGEVIWTRRMDRWVTGLERANNALLYSTTRHVGALDPADGHPLWRRDPGTPIAGIGLAADRLLIASADRNVALLEARFEGSPADGIGALQQIAGTTGLAFARHAEARGEDVVIADTFNHRVTMIRRGSDEPVVQTESFFPNQVQIQPDGSVLVVAEHANHITRHDPATGETVVLLSCGHPLFQSRVSPDEIRARQAETARYSPFGMGARSVCDSRIDPHSLYSPNGFHAVDDSTIYVADTDNHRVAMFDAKTGSLRGAVTGLNNPIRVIALPAGPVEEGN